MANFFKIPFETRVERVLHTLRKEAAYIATESLEEHARVARVTEEALRDDSIRDTVAKLSEDTIDSFEQLNQQFWESVLRITARHFGQDAVDEALKRLRQEIT